MPDQQPKPALPTGTVTMLFTDIAGSSRLWEEHGDHFIPVWQAHDAVIRDAITRFRGYEVKSEGDSFMVAFSDPADAINCSLFVQAALARYPWPTDIGPIRVRMGMHTGDPLVHNNDYFGPVVNRAAHICNAANGGQVLLSEETLQAAGGRHDTKVEFHDHGMRRLKDMGTSLKLFQAHHPSMEVREFLPPRSLEGQPNNLPVQRTSFVGRAKEIEQVAHYLAQGEKPVLTLTGPGGIGKTRLSLQAAAAKSEWFPDGVWYIKLVEARDLVGASIEIASEMKIPLNPDQPPLPQVREWLANRRCLLILDDAGSIPQADSLIRELVSGSAGLRCLATSRESLQIDEADDLPLTGLSTTPDLVEGEEAPGNLLTETEAGRLLLERRAESVTKITLSASEVAAIEQLLEDLEGMPVSIERVSVLMDSLAPSSILDWLRQRMGPATPSVSAGVEKFKGILRKSAQKVKYTLEEASKASSVNLSHLLQGIADVATDRRNEQQAAELGRESLRLSLEAGDSLGVAAALRQLARVRWNQGDRQSAVAILTTATQIYQRHHSEEYPEVKRELEQIREHLEHGEETLPTTSSMESAVALALGQTGE